jgi:hypothetical protein
VVQAVHGHGEAGGAGALVVPDAGPAERKDPPAHTVFGERYSI